MSDKMYNKFNTMFIISFMVLGSAFIASTLDWTNPVQNQNTSEIQSLKEEIESLKKQVSHLQTDISLSESDREFSKKADDFIIDGISKKLGQLHSEIYLLKKDREKVIQEVVMKNDLNAAKRSLGLPVYEQEEEIETREPESPRPEN